MPRKSVKYVRLIKRVICTDAIVLLWFVDAEEGLPMKLPMGNHDLELWGTFLFSYN